VAAGAELELVPGFSRLITLDRPAGDIIIGSAEVVDVTNQSDRQLVLAAKKPGRTNLIVLDTNNKEQYSTDILVRQPEPERSGYSGKTEVYARTRQVLHEYTAYYCPPGGGLCERVKDGLESFSRVQQSDQQAQSTNIQLVAPPAAPLPTPVPQGLQQ